jgi:hypothetical protein
MMYVAQRQVAPPSEALAFDFRLRAKSSQNVGLEMPALQIRIRYDGLLVVHDDTS